MSAQQQKRPEEDQRALEEIYSRLSEAYSGSSVLLSHAFTKAVQDFDLKREPLIKKDSE